ncbi:hypothetical protein HanXRQr2_Chr05g0203781 [Helianthus annuus]|uniref:Transposase (putative) gypsy type domain-containing protein n=1 Tax=Helianthus annuus TaxID=4232 RepID=A0A9K3IZK8_HELAN|nr:hypothetical protein HanXRQr2_Chr05g0203781 [Helianthus annuus]KAJ0569536.1 hypothetical protein HanHA300_Chr05g0167321 [Helianthus annuus]KAJ0583846.1 hypothetical protein HanHA89_Chr05g0181361 [Helianthus annuus]KAJ0921859.1 hypothetical protein HanPSC8_Chr05g0196621 [Helianthus annuus]
MFRSLSSSLIVPLRRPAQGCLLNICLSFLPAHGPRIVFFLRSFLEPLRKRARVFGTIPLQVPPVQCCSYALVASRWNFKFPESWGAVYPEDGQTAAQAPTGYITLFWDYFSEGNFRLPATKFFLDILNYYKFHISQLNPMGMVRIRHFEFLCRSMHIEPTVDRFRVFYQLHCAQGFYSFAQRPTAKKVLLVPPKSFHEWKPKFFYIKAGVIPMKMFFRGAEDIVTETLKTPESKVWYQDMKDVPSIELPERALVAAGMRLHWKMDRQNKLMYMEDDKIVALYVMAYKRECGKMSTVKKGANEDPLYYQIARNFVLPRDVDLSIGPESRKKKRVPIATAAPKKLETLKADVLREEKKKGTRLVSDPWCDYVVVSDTLQGLAPVAVRKPKAEPRDTADIPASNPDDPINLESSPEPLRRTKAVKRKPESEAVAQPAKKLTWKKIIKKGNLDTLATKLSPGECLLDFCFLIVLR